MRLLSSLLIYALVGSSITARVEDHGPFHPASVDVNFSPKGGATEACVEATGPAQCAPQAPFIG